MDIDDETLMAIKSELSLFRFAKEKFPDMSIKDVKACGCMGPMPECRCMKRERLVKAFLDANGHDKGNQ